MNNLFTEHTVVFAPSAISKILLTVISN